MTIERQRLYAETEEGSTVVLELTPSRLYPKRFMTMFTEGASDLAKMDRPPTYFRCLFALITMLDPQQFRRISARQVAQVAECSLPSAERSMKMLLSDNVIIADGEKTSARALRLNHHIVWAASAEKFNAKTASDPDPDIVDHYQQQGIVKRRKR